MHFFIKTIITLTYIFSFSQSTAQQQNTNNEPLAPKQEHANVLFAATSLLENWHYRKLVLNDSVSQVIFTNYLRSLDGSKSHFLAADIEYFKKYEYKLDDDIKATDLAFAYQVFNLYRERASARYAKIPSLLSQEFDFNADEYIETDYTKVAWASTFDELDMRWTQILKSQALSYRLADPKKPWNEIADALIKRYERVQKAVYQYNSEDVFQTFVNSFTSAYDPHTDYFSPIASENFQINMSLSLEGIGARLTQQLDYTQVADIVPGGPAYKSKLLEKDDRIIGVAQGDDGEFIDVIGWRLDDVVQKIRGPKESVVRLQILRKSGNYASLPDTIRLVREKIKLEDEAAKAEIVPYTDGKTTYQVGIITIPSFYISFEDRNKGVKEYKSTTRDVKVLLDDLKSKNVDAVLIDLRFNGGGSLDEAIALSGLFIPKGTMVQVRNKDNSIDQLNDEDGGSVYYNGPLGVLINRYSASASEIFAGAIQDYKRGVILGEASYGKGTVQNLIDLDRQIINYLNRMANIKQAAQQDASPYLSLKNSIQTGEIKLGQLKMTLAKFYRATGNSTQLHGVQPDIAFPSPVDSNEFGESGNKNALPWDEISSASYIPTNSISKELINKLQAIYLGDLQNDAELKKFAMEIERVKKEQQNTQLSLNIEKRSAENNESELNTSLGESEIDETETEVSKKLANDLYLKESLRLLTASLKIKSN